MQPSDLLHEKGDITFCPALVTLNDGNISIPVNNFTDHPYKLKKGLHIASFSVMTPEQMKYVKPVDPASTWNLLQNDQEKATHYVSSLIKTNKNSQNTENYWFPTPEDPGSPEEHTPIQRRILRDLQALQNLEISTQQQMRNPGPNSSKFQLEGFHPNFGRKSKNRRTPSGIPRHLRQT